jgi:hypothetical protein
MSLRYVVVHDVEHFAYPLKALKILTDKEDFSYFHFFHFQPVNGIKYEARAEQNANEG